MLPRSSVGTLGWRTSCSHIISFMPTSFGSPIPHSSSPRAQVFFVGTLWGTETFSWGTLANMLVITVGVCIAAYGEINFVLVGVREPPSLKPTEPSSGAYPTM